MCSVPALEISVTKCVFSFVCTSLCMCVFVLGFLSVQGAPGMDGLDGKDGKPGLRVRITHRHIACF